MDSKANNTQFELTLKSKEKSMKLDERFEELQEWSNQFKGLKEKLPFDFKKTFDQIRLENQKREQPFTNALIRKMLTKYRKLDVARMKKILKGNLTHLCDLYGENVEDKPIDKEVRKNAKESYFEILDKIGQSKEERRKNSKKKAEKRRAHELRMGTGKKAKAKAEAERKAKEAAAKAEEEKRAIEEEKKVKKLTLAKPKTASVIVKKKRKVLTLNR